MSAWDRETTAQLIKMLGEIRQEFDTPGGVSPERATELTSRAACAIITIMLRKAQEDLKKWQR